AGELVAAEAFPAPLALEAGEAVGVLDGHEQDHEHELGEGASVDAAGGGDEELAGGNPEAADELADAGAGGLDPLQARGCTMGMSGAAGEVEGDVGLADEAPPAGVVVRRSPEGGVAVVVGDVPGRGEELRRVEDLDVRHVLPDPLDVVLF